MLVDAGRGELEESAELTDSGFTLASEVVEDLLPGRLHGCPRRSDFLQRI